MKYSSFLYKEINYTKLGKRIARKTWNGYQQLIKSLKHSLRLLNEEKIHIDKEKTKHNYYYSCFEFSTHDQLMEKIEKDIENKIEKFENITDEDERKKLFKDFQNAKYAISKKIPLDILELELKESDNAGTILHNVVYKHKIKNLKSKDKRTLKTLEHYISMSKNYFFTKQQTRKYNNQTLMKEILFKIPEGQELTLTNEEWNVIIHNFKSEYFKNYDLYCYAIHKDCHEDEKIAQLKIKIDAKLAQINQAKEVKRKQMGQERAIKAQEAQAQAAQRQAQAAEQANFNQAMQNLNNDLQMQQLNNNLMMYNTMPKRYDVYLH